MIGGADENEPEARPPPPWPPIAPPSSPLPGPAGLGRRLLGSIRGALALPASPPAAAGPKVGLGLLLHLRPDHPLLHPPTPPASASEDPLEDDAAAATARPHADAGPRSPVNRDGIVADAAATSPGPTNATLGQWAANRAPRLLQYLRPAADTAGDQEFGLVDGQRADEFRAGDQSRSIHVVCPPEDESIATDVSSASEDDEPLGDAADAGLDSLVNPYTPSDAAAESAPANTPFRKWASKRAPHLLMPAAGDQESGLVDGQQAKEFRAGDESVPTCVASPSDDEEDESIATDVSSVSDQDGPLEDAVEWPHAAQGDAGAELALEDHGATAGDDQVEKVLQQCTGDQLRAARGDQEVVQQGAIHSRDETTCDIAAEDQEKVGSSENVDAVEGLELVQQDAIDRNGEGTDGTAAEDQNKAVEQVDAYGLGTTENGDAEDDREAVEQCVIDKEGAAVGAAVDDNAVKDHEVVGPAVMAGMCATIDDISAEDQQKKVEQCSTCDSETIENDDAMEDQEVVEQGVVYREGLTIDHDDYVEDHKVVEQSIIEGIPTSTYGIAVEDQEKVVEQCAVHEPIATKDECNAEEKEKVGDQEKKVEQCVTYDSETIENGDAVEDQEVVQQGVVYREGLTIGHDDYVEDHKVVELQSIIEGMAPSTYGIAVEDQEKVVEERAVHEPEATNDEYNVEEKEKVEDHEKKVEQCVTYDSETIENDDAVEDQEVVEQGVVYREGLTIGHYDYVEDHKVVEQSIIEGMPASTDVIAAEDQKKVVEQCVLHEPRATKDEYTVEEKDKVEDQEKNVEQCVIYDLETVKNVDDVEDQEVAEQGVVYREGFTIGHDEYVEDHKVVEQSTIGGMPVSTDDIAVEDQKKVLEQCALHEPRASKDEYTVEEKEKVVEQGAIDKQVATNMDVAVKDQDKLMKQHIIDNQGTVPMDDSAVKDCDKAATQNASDAIITYRDDDPVEELNKVGNQGVINENGRTKVDTNMEEHGYPKEQVIVDNWGTFSDATVLEDKKAEVELCNGDEQIADSVYMKGSMLEQRTGSKLEATKSDFTVENHKDVVERICHEWGAPDDDLAMDTAASQSIKEISSSELVSAAANGSDEGIGKEKIKLPIRYPQRPGKLNYPFYMSKGSCSYGFSCQFHHPPLKAKPDGSWSPSEQGNHGVAGILELNRIGLPIREGARNCTYYMRNGACRYGKHCHFNHPEHVIDAQFYAPTGWEDNALQLEKSSDDTTLDGTSHLKKSSDDATLDDTSYSKKSSDHATLADTAYSKKSSDHATLDDTSSSSAVLPPNILRMLLPPQKVLPSAEGKVKKVAKFRLNQPNIRCSSSAHTEANCPVIQTLQSIQLQDVVLNDDSGWSSTSDDSDGCCSADSSDGPLCKQEPVHSSDGPLCKQEQHVDYPDRPGRPECPFYLRFGDCKFASACKYHHSKDKYPELPGEPECPFYMKNRFCKFGAQCRFNHPKDWSPTAESPTNAKKSVAIHERHESTRIAVEDHVPQQQQYPERPGQPDCRYYLQFGKCKFMSACIFHHPRDGLPVGSNPSGPAHSDQIGPETHDMPECPFYMKTGKCQFGSACEFHHPKDTCSTTEGEFGHKTDLALDNFTRPENAVQTQEQIMYPERPGEPRCFNYMRHGFCRFQMNCKYHHPADRLSRKQYDSTYH